MRVEFVDGSDARNKSFVVVLAKTRPPEPPHFCHQSLTRVTGLVLVLQLVSVGYLLQGIVVVVSSSLTWTSVFYLPCRMGQSPEEGGGPGLMWGHIHELHSEFV